MTTTQNDRGWVQIRVIAEGGRYQVHLVLQFSDGAVQRYVGDIYSEVEAANAECKRLAEEIKTFFGMETVCERTARREVN